MAHTTSNMNDDLSNEDQSNFPNPIPYSSLNVSEIQLITFDFFGALMLTESSLKHTIHELLPSLTLSDADNFAKNWRVMYTSFFGKSFLPSLTQQPFLWVVRSTLLDILRSFNLSNVVPEDSAIFNSLVAAWRNLQPRPGVVEVLSKLSNKYQLGLLSNGDKDTLEAATQVFPASVKFSCILSSDYPVNCFKPSSAMYAQALAIVEGDQKKLFHIAGSEYDAHGARNCGIFSGILNPALMQTDSESYLVFRDITELATFFDT